MGRTGGGAAGAARPLAAARLGMLYSPILARRRVWGPAPARDLE
jgi:hypothetical protein